MLHSSAKVCNINPLKHKKHNKIICNLVIKKSWNGTYNCVIFQLKKNSYESTQNVQYESIKNNVQNMWNIDVKFTQCTYVHR